MRVLFLGETPELADLDDPAVPAGMTPEKIRADIERDTILTAEQAKEYGLVDDIISSRKLSALAT